MLGKCWNCQTEIAEYTRSTLCQNCGKEVRVCKGCLFYNPAFARACRETQAEPVLDLEKSNFCEYFKPQSHYSTQDSKAHLLKNAEALFKKFEPDSLE